MQTFDKAILSLENQDENEVANAAEFLGELGNNTAIQNLRNALIKTESAIERNAIAIALGKLKAEESAEDLMKLIKKPDYQNCRGSLLYALKMLDYKNYLIDIVEIVCKGNFECKVMSLKMIEEFEGMVSWDIVEKGKKILRYHLDFVDKEDYFVKEALEIFEEVEFSPNDDK